MDYLKTLWEAVFESPAHGETLIGYNNGLVIVSLLLVIFWALIRNNFKRKLEFPLFCNDCKFYRPLKAGICRKVCKFHPLHKDSSNKSYYEK